jgi:hypothetical protein
MTAYGYEPIPGAFPTYRVHDHARVVGEIVHYPGGRGFGLHWYGVAGGHIVTTGYKTRAMAARAIDERVGGNHMSEDKKINTITVEVIGMKKIQDLLNDPALYKRLEQELADAIKELHIGVTTDETETEKLKPLGALGADEKRLQDAAERSGILYCGCDTPDALADEIERLRAALEKIVEADLPSNNWSSNLLKQYAREALEGGK